MEVNDFLDAVISAFPTAPGLNSFFLEHKHVWPAPHLPDSFVFRQAPQLALHASAVLSRELCGCSEAQNTASLPHPAKQRCGERGDSFHMPAGRPHRGGGKGKDGIKWDEVGGNGMRRSKMG